MKRASAAIIFLLLCHSAKAQEAGLLFSQANQAYRGGEYEKASAMYEQIIQNGYESPALYYNLGNARFKLNDIPGAILNFERAKRLDPRDEDIDYNLRIANLRIVDKIEPIPVLFIVEWWRAVVRLYSSESWALIAVIGLWSAVVLAVAVMILKAVFLRKLIALAALIFFMVSVFSSVGMAIQSGHERSELTAIVFVPSVSVKSSPDTKSVDLFLLHEGVKVELLDSVENWRKIRLPDGKIGWIPGESITII